jgi:hypothetical protein
MASSSGSADGSKSQTIKIAAVVVLLLAAAVVVGIYLKGDGVSSEGEASASTPYVCEADGETLAVTPAEYEKMRAAGDVGTREGTQGRGFGLYVRCPKCKKKLMAMGYRCPKDKTVFAPLTMDGQPAACPKCGAKPAEGADQPAS